MVTLFVKLVEHLKGHPGEYLLLLVIAVGAGWQGNAMAQRWLNGQIKAIVVAESEPIKQEVKMISETVDSLLAQNLRAELREIRTLLCYSPGDTRLARDYDDLHEKYQSVTGKIYDPPPCEILKKMG